MRTSTAPRSDLAYEAFRTVVDILQSRAADQPDQNAYRFLKDGEEETSSLTYEQLDRKARACGAYLEKLGLSGQRALLLLPSGPEFIEAFFGCLYAGVTAVPAYAPRNGRSLPRIQGILEDANASAVLATEASVTKIRSLIGESTDTGELQYVTTDTIAEETADDWQQPWINSETLAFLQYTSGSTGSPKGVMVTHGNILSNLKIIRAASQLSEEDIVIGWLPLFHDMGLIANVLEPIYMGIPSILMSPAAFLKEPFRWLRAISKYRATASGGPNFAYELCLSKIPPEKRVTLDLSSWRVAFNGAEPIRATTLEAFSRAFAPCGFRSGAFLPCYGMAEATLMVSGGPADEAPPIVLVDGDDLETRQHVTRAFPKASNTRSLVGCGDQAPGSLPGQRVAIVNPETCARCLPNEIGEIWVAGPHVAKGYWNRTEETRVTFEAFTADTGEGPFLRTGDLGFLHRGELVATGRLKDLIILHGRNIYPQDVEWTTEQSHRALAEGGGAAFSIEVENEEKLIVVQELTLRQKPDIKEVLGRIRQAVADVHEIPVHEIVLIKPLSLPKTSSGKVQRQTTKARYLAGELRVVATWSAKARDQERAKTAAPERHHKASSIHDLPNGPSKELVQDWLVAELATKLQIPPSEIDTHQPFTYYGLASVEGVALSAKLEGWLGRAMPLSLVWDYPTIDAASRFLSAV